MAHPDLNDRDVIIRSLGDAAAFEVIFERHYDAVSRFLARRLPHDLAADLVSETFTRACAARGRFDPSYDCALPYLLGIAVRLLQRHRRSERRMLRAYAREGQWRDYVAPSDPSDDREVASALADLRQEDRDVVLLYARADLDYGQIATALGVPVGTVRSRLSRARARLRKRLRPDVSPTGEEAFDG